MPADVLLFVAEKKTMIADSWPELLPHVNIHVLGMEINETVMESE